MTRRRVPVAWAVSLLLGTLLSLVVTIVRVAGRRRGRHRSVRLTRGPVCAPSRPSGRADPDRGRWWSTEAYLPRLGGNDHGSVIMSLRCRRSGPDGPGSG